ncbi:MULTISPECIES: BLUF domain-containing protein [Maribacter]|uniref:BLUF domain-containing protein n=1 Tax=Maribacter flavus TaxID=1658664 RepID=A0ABU7IIR7_9FLAO|nr:MULTISPECIES: BLUF domain-containing protein [Maribacter]MDC6405913.1 BLUF domain-containing protein [Maribacter sp. PR66]MEE1972835.1 BLUF domain-containing protein [Maribacter flavus]
MLHINFEHPFDQLRKLALSLGADFKEYQDSAILTLDNLVGKGTVTTYSVFEGLNVRVYDITFNEELKISKMEQDPSIIYFLYCVKGHFFHRFENQENNNKIYPRQNVIFSSAAKSPNIVTFPGKVHLRLSAIFVREKMAESNSKRKTLLETALEDITSFISKEKPFSYYGEISPLTSKYASILIENKRTDAVGKLLVEGAVVNTLASQVEHHDVTKEEIKISFPLSNTEILRISEVAEHIAENIDRSLNIDHLSKTFGLSPKKLQAGFRHLFGESLGNFITHLRLEKGKELIQHTDLTISEVCYKIGFSSRSYFSKTFSERFGLLPSKFKSSLSSDDLIYELTYKSTMSDGIQISDIEDIIEVANSVNQENNITGCLVCQDNDFFQLLEGPKSNVLQVFDKIKKDPRHYDLEVLTRKINSHRFFPNWSMALLSDKDILDQTFKYKAINLNLDTSGIRGNENVHISSTVFWRRVLNLIKVSQA